jgi:hypothetical protein
LIVIHLDEFIQVDAVEVEDDAEMVAPDEVVLQFDHPFDGIRVILLQEQKQLGFHGRLIVVLLLVFDHLDGDVAS